MLHRHHESGLAALDAQIEGVAAGLREIGARLEVIKATAAGIHSDAAHKLALLAHTAFAHWLHPTKIERTGIESLNAQSVREAAKAGHSIRLVASLHCDLEGVRASVRPQLVGRNHAFAKTLNEENGLEIHPEGGEIVYVRCKGAGRWPATESVVADVLDLYRDNSTLPRVLDLQQNLTMREHNEQNAHAPLGD